LQMLPMLQEIMGLIDLIYICVYIVLFFERNLSEVFAVPTSPIDFALSCHPGSREAGWLVC